MAGLSKGGVERFLPGLAALKQYDRAWLRFDVIAGISVAAAAMPIAIAYSQLVGVPPVYGLYAGLLPLIVYAFFGSSRQLILAPDAATCAIVATVVAPLAGTDGDHYLALTSALAVITGCFCILAGFARLGFLTNFLSRPILTGYLNGIAICIIAGQLGGLFGFKMRSSGFFRTLWQFFARIDETSIETLAVGVVTLALLLLTSRWAPRLPGPLLVAVLGVAVAAMLDLERYGVALLGEIPAGLPSPRVPKVGADDWEFLMVGAAGLALISYNSAMVTARGFAVKNRYDINPNQEFIALGVANIGAGALQGFAISGADSRTAVNDSAGGKSQVTGLVAAGVMALTLLFLTPPLRWLPIAVLSAVLMKSAIGLFDLKGLMTLRRVSRREFQLCLVALFGVITVGVLPGVVVAIGLSLVELLARASRPHDAELGRIAGTTSYRDVANFPTAEIFTGVLIYRFDSSLVFFNSDYFKLRITTKIREAVAPVRHFVLDAEAMPYIDTTGADVLDQVRGKLEEAGIRFAIACAKGPARGMLERSGFMDRLGPEWMFPTVQSAIAAAVGASTTVSNDSTDRMGNGIA